MMFPQRAIRSASSRVDKTAVGIDMEDHVRVLFKDLKNVLFEERFPSGNHAEIDPHLFGLIQHPVDVGQGEFRLPCVTSGVTAEAAEIAAHGGTDDQEAGWVKTAVLLGKGLAPVGAHQQLIDDEGLNDGFTVVRVGPVEDFPGHLQGRDGPGRRGPGSS